MKLSFVLLLSSTFLFASLLPTQAKDKVVKVMGTVKSVTVTHGSDGSIKSTEIICEAPWDVVCYTRIVTDGDAGIDTNGEKQTILLPNNVVLEGVMLDPQITVTGKGKDKNLRTKIYGISGH